MTAVRCLGLAALLMLASGCMPVDSLHYVTGEAPQSSNCEILVSEIDDSYEKTREKVSGPFRLSYVASGPFPSRVNVAAYCDGTKVKELKGISPRRVGNTDLGKLAP
jgi:hypothetical protein